MDTIYMDYNATTPIRGEVLAVMDRVSRECFGNPSSIHMSGRASRTCMQQAREQVADSIGARPHEIIFTSGGSESDNLAIKGVAETHERGHVITTIIEHPAVLRTCDYLETRGFDVSVVPVDEGGFVDPQGIAEEIRDDTILISVMWANNEAGHIQPIDTIGKIARDRGVLFHTDAVQAFGKVPIDVSQTPVDLLSISGHKFYAPKGVGALYVRDGVALRSAVHGGGQEAGLRAGTENVIGVAAMGEACRLAVRDLTREATRLAALRDRLEAEILRVVPECRVAGDRRQRLPNTSNIAFRGVEAGWVIRRLDELGIAVSGASACASGHGEPSQALINGLGLTREEAIGSVRFSLGHDSRASHVDALLRLLPDIVRELRASDVSGRIKN